MYLVARKIRTSIVLTASAEAILQKYRNAFGLKGPLSVGLELFDTLDPGEQQARIDRTKEADKAERAAQEAAGAEQRMSGLQRKRRGTG